MTKRSNLLSRIAILVVLGAGVGSCSGGGLGLPPLSVLLFNFAPGFAGVHLNAPLELTFSTQVDATTVNPDSIRIFTITTTTQNPDPGAPAVGDFIVTGNVVVFLPRVPEQADLSDAGLRIGFRYTIQVPSSPDVIEPVRTIEGDPNLVSFTEFFTTLNQTILPAPGDITAEPNLNSLHLFFIDEGIENGVDPCPRNLLPVADQDSPQVIDTDPDEGESGFGTITGIQAGLGTAFVRLDPITVEFSEPISPWRIRQQNISIRNTNLGGETFDLFFFFTQDRSQARLQITVFDADSAFDQASVPQGRYVLSLTAFTDLAGNPLVNSGTCVADGTFNLSFSTVSSPALPTDLTLTFQDDDQDGHVDVGGLKTAINDPNVLPLHEAPFLGGFAVDHVSVPSPSAVTSSANWGNTAFWTGCEVRYDNGFDPNDPNHAVPDALRLRGGTFTGATPIMAPIAGRAIGRSDPSGSLDGSTPSAEPGKVDFSLVGSGTATLFTGNASTGPILYHYNAFDLREDSSGNRPTLTFRSDSIFPLLIFVEDDAIISGTILCDGGDGDLGFNGDNGGTPGARNPGGLGGFAGPGGGAGGDGGSSTLGSDPELINGQTGGVPGNVLGPLTQLSEQMAGLAGMVTGGGGHFDATQPKFDSGGNPNPIPAYQGGGGGGQFEGGTSGADIDTVTPGESDQGVGGQQIGSDPGFSEPDILATGGAGGGGGAADDDGGSSAGGQGVDVNGVADTPDDGGGGGGGGGGFFGLACAGDVDIGEIDDNGTPGDPSDDIARFAIIRCVGGRGGSTYATVSGNPPVPGSDPLNPDISSPVGQGEAGGGGGGGGICLIAGGSLNFVAAEIYAFGKLGGNAPSIEGGGRGSQGESIQGGNGGGGELFFADADGIDPINELQSNNNIQLAPDPLRDLDGDTIPDLDPVADADIIQDLNEMSGSVLINLGVWGDEPRERMFGTSQIVTEFFDTLSDSVSYDAIRTLSNAPRFPYSIPSPDLRTIRVFLDTAETGSGGLPDLSTEDPVTGALAQPNGFTIEAGLHFDQTTGLSAGAPQYDSRFLIAANSPSLGNRFARVRIVFDLSQISTDRDVLLDSFAPAGAGNVPIADDPSTPAVIENSLGNIDTAPDGVPAVAEVRVRFTP